MGIKVKAFERNISFEKGKKSFAYVMQTNHYSLMEADKVIQQASLLTGIPKTLLQACWNGIGEVIKTWVTEGHCVSIPGLGNLRFGVRGASFKNPAEADESLITSRRVIFIPNVDIKRALAETPVTITCYNRKGEMVDSNKGELVASKNSE